jgi:hypothetical protein
LITLEGPLRRDCATVNDDQKFIFNYGQEIIFNYGQEVAGFILKFEIVENGHQE